MTDDAASSTVIARASLREYFQGSVDEALNNQGVEAAVETIYYVVNVLTMFQRADRLYDATDQGLTLRPLALLYADAVQGRNPDDRVRSLQRLGDIALFISGVFSESLNRKAIDVDYYIAMGSSAYANLSEAVRGGVKGQAFGEIFEELARKFTAFVDVLSEVNENTSLSSNADVMRLYELWLRTGSKRAARRLRDLGIEPSTASATLERH